MSRRSHDRVSRERARPRSRLILSLLGAGLVVGLAACGQSGTELSDGASADDVEAGRIAYERSCAACHGVGGQGTDQGPPFIDEIYEPSHHADGAFLLAVRNGVRAHHWNFGDMPRQEGLSDQEVAQIVAYVRGVQRDAGIE
ncbi:MAG: cytochrome c [Thermoleophilia bacterium]|nr:cytochrome c [Thermoleophilia bacterium]